MIPEYITAYEMKERGLLLEIEPGTGSGAATNDLRIEIESLVIDIEIKSLTSNNPSNRMIDELVDKNKKLPSDVLYPIIFMINIIETDNYDYINEGKKIDQKMNEIQNVMKKVSTIVICKLFIDGNGGRTKRELIRIIQNNENKLLSDDIVNKLIGNNFSNKIYPISGVSNFMKYSIKHDTL